LRGFSTEWRDTTIFLAQHIETFDFSERANRFDREEKNKSGVDGWLAGWVKWVGNMEGCDGWMEDGDRLLHYMVDRLPSFGSGLGWMAWNIDGPQLRGSRC
jgi:hypothetical protein